MRLSVVTTSFLRSRNRFATFRASDSNPPVFVRRSRITAFMPCALNSRSLARTSSFATFENVESSMCAIPPGSKSAFTGGIVICSRTISTAISSVGRSIRPTSMPRRHT